MMLFVARSAHVFGALVKLGISFKTIKTSLYFLYVIQTLFWKFAKKRFTLE
jgi:hypothetical protein